MANLRIGLLGGGRIGKLHGTNIQNLIKGAEVVMLADPFLNEDIGSLGEEHRHSGLLVRIRYDVFKNPDVDAVFICSSTDTSRRFHHPRR